MAARIRTRQQQLGLKTRDVAERLGYSEARYGNYARGARVPDYQALVRICDVLELTPGQLLGTEPMPSGEPVPAHRAAVLAEAERQLSRLSLEDLRLAVRLLRAVRSTD